jgi:hypothetical protein
MSIGCYYEDSFLTDGKPADSYFTDPQDIDHLELGLYQFGGSDGVMYVFYFFVTRKPVEYLLTGDCVAGKFDTLEERDKAAIAFARKLRERFVVKVIPHEKVKLFGGKVSFPEVEAPIDVSRFE